MIEYTVKVDTYGDKEWYLNGELHRVDGPAIERGNGTKCWFRHGKRHREDGPAIEWSDGDKFWYLDDELHREDGPAIEDVDGNKEWYIDGKELTEKEFTQLNQIVTIGGVQYKLTRI